MALNKLDKNINKNRKWRENSYWYFDSIYF